MVWPFPSRPVTVAGPPKVCGTPCQASTSAATNAIGSNTYSVARTMSVQKLPIVGDVRRVRPRTSAIAMASPTAADTKFWTARPAAWVRWAIVDSPP